MAQPPQQRPHEWPCWVPVATQGQKLYVSWLCTQASKYPLSLGTRKLAR